MKINFTESWVTSKQYPKIEAKLLIVLIVSVKTAKTVKTL